MPAISGGTAVSLCVAINGPEGVVLGADTRLTLSRGEHPVTFDNASKLLHISDSVAAATYGTATIGTQPVHTFVSAFKRQLPDLLRTDGRTDVGGMDPPLTVKEYAEYLRRFFLDKWKAAHGETPPSTSLLVGGVSLGEPHGEVARIDNFASPVVETPWRFGMRWGGQVGTVNRLVKGCDPSLLRHFADQYPTEIGTSILDHFKKWDSQTNVTLPYDSMPLQDCIDLAVLLIDTTIRLQSLSMTDRGVGGQVEIMAITPEGGTEWIRRRTTNGGR